MAITAARADGSPPHCLPPDGDYFVRHLSRHPARCAGGMLSLRSGAPGFSASCKRTGTWERINAGTAPRFRHRDSLDLDAYYRYISESITSAPAWTAWCATTWKRWRWPLGHVEGMGACVIFAPCSRATAT